MNRFFAPGWANLLRRKKRSLNTSSGQSKIYTLGQHWMEKTTICHDDRVCSAKFTGDGKHVVTRSIDGQSKIHVLNSDGHWVVERNLPQGTRIKFAEFSPDGLRVAIIVNTDTLRIFGQGTDGILAEEDNFSDSDRTYLVPVRKPSQFSR